MDIDTRLSYVNNKGAYQPAHPRSLISAFAVRFSRKYYSPWYTQIFNDPANLCICAGLPGRATHPPRRHAFSLRGPSIFTYPLLISVSSCLLFLTIRLGTSLQSNTPFLGLIASRRWALRRFMHFIFNIWTSTWDFASSQAKGTKSTSFLTRKERSGLSTLGLRRWGVCYTNHIVEQRSLMQANTNEKTRQSFGCLDTPSKDAEKQTQTQKYRPLAPLDSDKST